MHKEHEPYMRLALDEARKALDVGEFPVGCVLVHEGRVVAAGGRENSGVDGNEFDHAEIVALRRLLDTNPSLDFTEIAVYSTLEPCLMCFTTLILNGFRTIVYGYEDVMGGGSSLELERLSPLYASMQVKVIPGVERAGCLDLFQRFFRDEKNDYWRDSPLSQYTLEQHLD
ncbi:MAG: nucleoside deaminase [Desulfofustis sp.]|nr:nucleoside deaminase [Desulfofustis sp.]NNK56388.1 nucleoside deaminase [Desulfofustis sp.]